MNTRYRTDTNVRCPATRRFAVEGGGGLNRRTRGGTHIPAGGEIESDDFAFEGRSGDVVLAGILEHGPEETLKGHAYLKTLYSSTAAV